MPKPVALASSSHHITAPLRPAANLLVSRTGRFSVSLVLVSLRPIAVPSRQPSVNAAKYYDVPHSREKPWTTTRKPLVFGDKSTPQQKQVNIKGLARQPGPASETAHMLDLDVAE